MKKFINTMLTAVFMMSASETFAQDDIYAANEAPKIDKNTVAMKYSNDANRRLISRINDVLHQPDCDDCLYPVSMQRGSIAKNLMAYDKKSGGILFGGKEIAAKDLPDILSQSDIIYGYQINGSLLVSSSDETGLGMKVTPYIPRGNDKFVAYKGVPFIMVLGKPTKPEVKVVASQTAAPYTEKKAPPVAVKPAPDTAKAKKEESGNTVVNIFNYNGTGNSSSTGYYYEEVDLAKKVYPIGYFASHPYQPQTYGAPYGYYNVTPGISVSLFWWGGNPYYYWDNWWWCHRTGKRACNADYGALCKTYGTPASSNYNAPASSASQTVYEGPRTTVKTYGGSGNTAMSSSNYNPPRQSGGSYHSSEQPKTYGGGASGGYHPSGQPKTYGR